MPRLTLAPLARAPALLVGAQLGWDERSGLPGLPTGIVREIEPLAGGATTVWHALQQGW